MLVDRLSEMPCDGGLGGEVFAASQLRDYGWLNWDFRGGDGLLASFCEAQVVPVGICEVEIQVARALFEDLRTYGTSRKNGSLRGCRKHRWDSRGH